MKAERDTFVDLVGAVVFHRDRKAFSALFDYFLPRLKAYLMRRGASPELAEELAQEVLATLWLKGSLFDPQKSSLATWLFRIARNALIDHRRRQASGGYTFVGMEDAPVLVADEVDPAVTIDGTRRDLKVREALEALPDGQREVLILAFYEGLSQQEIAVRTGQPLGTVKSRMRLAFARLRRASLGDSLFETD